MIGISLRQAAILSGVPKTTFCRWRSEGKLAPDVADSKGVFCLYSEAQVEKARELDNARKAKTADIAADDTDDGNSPAQVDNSEAPPVSVASPLTIESPAQIVTLEDRANRIRQLQADVQRGIIAIGFELIAAKKEIRHGGWAEWLADNFDWTQQTANRFMRVAERFGKLNNVVQFKPSTLQLMLALPDGDEEAFIEAQARAGKPLENQSAREVQKSIEEWKSAPDTFSFEDKHDQFEVGGQYLRLLPNAPSIEDAIQMTQEPVKKKAPITFNRGGDNFEYFTPATYVDAARAVLGDIDLDPASCESANQTVKAKSFFTADDDGLQKDWRGRIWLNPPFTSGLIEKFVDKLGAEISAGNVTSAIVLVDNATETRWFKKLALTCAGMVFTTGRINFLKGGNLESGSPTRGQVFLYFGADSDSFFRVFQAFGWAARVLDSENPKCSRPT